MIPQSENMTIKDVTLKELEQIIESVIESKQKEMSESKNKEEQYKTFLETFGKWEDDRTTEEIIASIYDNRNCK
ncbi:MAG: hypothetical protein QNJ42_13710 [Crocosphaera sp.]|nr:hypothetical protein [Crocosphaera sp.]